MSFFFSKKKQQPKAAAAKPRQANKNAKETLNRLGCKVCPLDKANGCTPKMQPDIVNHTDIYLLGDSPNAVDDKKGTPFSGKVGKLLRDLLDPDLEYSFDNCVRDVDGTGDSTWVALECCRSLVTKSIEQAKPKLIVGLGIVPLQWMLNSSDMIGLRGRVFAVKVGKHACYFLPTYHPAYVLEKAYDEAKPLFSKLGHCLKFDLAKAAKLVATLETPIIDTPQSARAGVQAFNGHGNGQLGQVLALISAARRAPEKAIDLETFPLRPYATNAKLLTCALSFEDTNFAFAIDHPKAGWRPEEKTQIKAALKDLLTDATSIIAHNAPFEVEWLIFLLGRDVVFHDVWECTMMQAHFLDERRGKRGGNDDQYQPNPYQALDFLVKQYFGLPYKALFKLNRKRMDEAELDETLLYNGADTKYTLRLFHLQKAFLKQAGLLAAYREAQARQPAVALMQSMGIVVDQAQNKTLQAKLKGEINEIQARIESYPEVKAFIRDRKAFNCASAPDVLKLLKDYVKEGASLVNADGKESVDKAVLERIHHPIGKDIENFRNRSKLKSTYVDPFELGKGAFIWPDGKIHQSFNTTFAETGRTTCDSPNQQNWPHRKDAWVRQQLVAPKGHVLVAFDYGQLEACTGAMCSRDKTFVKALWEDYDIHMEWARRAATLHPALIGGRHNLEDKVKMKEFRSLVKNKLVFPAFFGAKKESIAGYLTTATGVDVPQRTVDKLFDEFWQAFSGVLSWQKRLVNDYYDNGYVCSPTGRMRHYPLTRNQAINYPIQSVACDIVCRAMVHLSVRAVECGRWWLHPIMNIHDDLSFVIPDQPKILEEAIESIYRMMLAPSYDFINVPLSVTCSIGQNWLEMKDVGKFWSHKDL